MVIPRLGFGFHKKGQAIVAVFRTNVKLPFDVAEVDTVASFSSVGPSSTPTLKPDVAAPGYLILSASAGPVAAWPG